MNGKIWILNGSGHLVPMHEADFALETDFQTLLATHPDLLAGEQMNEAQPRRFFLVAREFGVPGEEDGAGRWALDHLFLDQDGVPTLVEVKRRSDSRLTSSRREVVGQMLDYAANGARFWPLDALRASALSRDAALREFLQTDEDEEIEAFWERVGENLRTHRLRLVFVADVLPEELRRIIEFLNLNSRENLEVLGVEIRRFVGTDNLQTLVPRVVGNFTKAPPVARQSRQWDETDFFDELARNTSNEAETVARAIYQWAQQRELRIWWGNGKRSGSFFPILWQNEHWHTLFSVWTSGSLEIGFQHLKKRPPFDSAERRAEFLRRLNALCDDYFAPEAIERRPNIALEQFAGARTEPLLRELDWLLEQFAASN